MRRHRPWRVVQRLFVTDLDGTLLDDSYDFQPARPALAALASAHAGLVLASSKTRAEMEPLARRLGSPPTMIVENGGALLIPRDDGGFEALARGVPHVELRVALGEIALEADATLQGLSSMSLDRVVELTGLDRDAARLAVAREYDEPFVLADTARLSAVAAAVERRGLRMTRGGRFFHLTGATDKGEALRELFELLGRPAESVGLGDAPNDLSLLRAVDRPIVVPNRAGRIDPELAAALPGAERAPAPGPSGWNAAVLAVLAGGRLPGVTARGGL